MQMGFVKNVRLIVRRLNIYFCDKANFRTAVAQFVELNLDFPSWDYAHLDHQVKRYTVE